MQDNDNFTLKVLELLLHEVAQQKWYVQDDDGRREISSIEGKELLRALRQKPGYKKDEDKSSEYHYDESDDNASMLVVTRLPPAQMQKGGTQMLNKTPLPEKPRKEVPDWLKKKQEYVPGSTKQEPSYFFEPQNPAKRKTRPHAPNPLANRPGGPKIQQEPSQANPLNRMQVIRKK